MEFSLETIALIISLGGNVILLLRTFKLDAKNSVSKDHEQDKKIVALSGRIDVMENSIKHIEELIEEIWATLQAKK